MNISTTRLGHFVQAGQAAQSAVDRLIARADLLRVVHERKAALTVIVLARDDDVTDAQLRLAAAEAALEDFERQAGRAPA